MFAVLHLLCALWCTCMMAATYSVGGKVSDFVFWVVMSVFNVCVYTFRMRDYREL